MTNGPLIEFAVNGQGMGEVIQASADAPYRARIVAEITARVPLARIELLANGRVIETRGVSPSERTARVVTEARVTKSTWFAVRVTGRPARGIEQIPRAHSGPVYVHIGRQPVLVKRDIELLVRWVDRLWLYLEERDNFGPGDNRQRAREMIDAARAHYTEKLRRAG